MQHLISLDEVTIPTLWIHPYACLYLHKNADIGYEALGCYTDNKSARLMSYMTSFSGMYAQVTYSPTRGDGPHREIALSPVLDRMIRSQDSMQLSLQYLNRDNISKMNNGPACPALLTFTTCSSLISTGPSLPRILLIPIPQLHLRATLFGGWRIRVFTPRQCITVSPTGWIARMTFALVETLDQTLIHGLHGGLTEAPSPSEADALDRAACIGYYSAAFTVHMNHESTRVKSPETLSRPCGAGDWRNR